MPAIDLYFKAMVDRGASDFHLASGTLPMYRIAGNMVPAGGEAMTTEATEKLIYEIMPERNRQEWEQCHDTDFAYELGEQARFRCNVFSDRKGIGAVFRLIPTKIFSFNQLALPECVKKFCFLSKGLVFLI